jgi:hypothetical protein
MYGVSYACADWTFGMNDYQNKEFLSKCEMICKLLGYDLIKDLQFVDYCILFDCRQGETVFNQVYEWWLKHKSDDSKLNKDIIKMIYL